MATTNLCVAFNNLKKEKHLNSSKIYIKDLIKNIYLINITVISKQIRDYRTIAIMAPHYIKQ